MPNAWLLALKEYSKKKGMYCVPKKGSKEYDEVMKIKEKLMKDKPKPKTEKKKKEKEDVLKQAQMFLKEDKAEMKAEKKAEKEAEKEAKKASKKPKKKTDKPKKKKMKVVKEFTEQEA